jgi:hypothetical protein
MTKEQRTLSVLYDLQDVVQEGTDFSRALNELVGELEKYIQEQLIPCL